MTQVTVGQVVRETIPVDSDGKSVHVDLPVIDPPGSTVVSLGGLESGTADQVTLTMVFLKPGPVTIGRVRFVVDGMEKFALADRKFRVRPWPDFPPTIGQTIRAGVGTLEGKMETNLLQMPAGTTSTVTLQTVGSASLAIVDPPGLMIDSEEPPTGGASSYRLRLIEDRIDWGDVAGSLPTRTWVYEFQAVKPGRYRILPLRLLHLDDDRRIQTRLISGVTLEVHTRRSSQAEFLMRDRQAIDEKSCRPGQLSSTAFIVILALSIMTGMLALLVYMNHKHNFLLKLRLKRAVGQAITAERALGEFRDIDPKWRMVRNSMSPTDRERYDLILRAAFQNTTSSKMKTNQGV